MPGDAEQPWLAAGGMLPGDQTKPGTQIPGFGEAAGIAHICDPGRCIQHANAGDAARPHGGLWTKATNFDSDPKSLATGADIAPACAMWPCIHPNEPAVSRIEIASGCTGPGRATGRQPCSLAYCGR